MTANLQAFLTLISHSEGTDRTPEPYRCVYGYQYVIRDLNYHPAESRPPDNLPEWKGKQLPDAMCIALGLHPPCHSTAAGRYQLILPTWLRLKGVLQLRNFGPESQDDCAVQIIKERGALDLIYGGEIAAAISKCSAEWASLPGSGAQQPQKTFAQLLNVYSTNGGGFA